ncbi:MAG: oxidoreductase [Candidatus Roseilinea sp.]|nr:MAG: oxidoreductase [Candidatus Roseilinea sp.]
MINFAVIGINHNHIYGQVRALLGAGARFVSFYAPEPELAAPFAATFPQATRARNEAEILEDPRIHLVVTAGIPCERAPLGIRVMQHGKDFMTDKPGFTTLDQLAEARRVQAETQHIYSVCYSERFESRATVKAGELVQAGAIGRAIQTIGLGPHRANLSARPAWFFERQKYGGILCDIGSHQADQFLFLTGSTEAEVVAAQVGNIAHPQFPELEDFGDVIWRGNGGVGYARVDWFTPDGLGVWGDGRLIVLGEEGYIEVRKSVDLVGRAGGDHLFIVDRWGTRYVDCSDVELPYGRQLVHDVLNRTETAMSQAHCFLASELALKAQAAAHRLKPVAAGFMPAADGAQP